MQVLTIPVTPFMQNCRVLVCPTSRIAAIVDPGGEPEKIIARLSEEGLKPKMILLTHAHLDHVGASTKLGEYYDIEIIGPHKDDLFWLEALPMQSQMFGFENHAAFLPSSWLDDGDTVEVGKLKLEVRHCPGHTPGHVVFYEPVSQQVLVGDVLFKGSVGRTDFPKGDAAKLKHSIESKLFSLPNEVVVHSGHGENTTIGYEKATNPFMSGRFG